MLAATPGGEDRRDSSKHYYLKQSLYAGLGKRIVDDFADFGWAKCLEIAMANSWGALSTNMLFIGQPGVVTPGGCGPPFSPRAVGKLRGSLDWS